jgi:hypothetical protein
METFKRLWDDRDKIRILTWVAEGVDAEAAKALVELIGRYNGFDPARVKEAIDACPKECCFQIGREYSPVIYVGLPYGLDNLERLKETVLEAFALAFPDETPPIEGYHSGSTTLRFWWD